MWNLNTKNNQWCHRFLVLTNGFRLHYLTLATGLNATHHRLIIFIHGFPDSCHLWTQMLQSSLSSCANLISLDLPGFGGSDSLNSYGPDQVLATVGDAIRELKLLHSKNDIECTVVGHDWGGIIASRIASHTEGLIDRLVLVNSLFVSTRPCESVVKLTIVISPPISSLERKYMLLELCHGLVLAQKRCHS